MKSNRLQTFARWFPLTGLALGLLFSQAGCVHITPTPEPATVRFMCPAEQHAHYEPLIEQFTRKNKHITIELVKPVGYRWPEADVFETSPFMRRFMGAEEEFGVIDLLPYVDQGEFERQDYRAGLMAMFEDEEEGEIWAAPYTIGLGVMYYNRDLFDRYDVDYPTVDWTWEDFQGAAQKMYDPGRGVFGYVPDADHNDIIAMVYQNGGRIFDDFSNPTRTTFDEPLTVEAVEWYAKLMFEYDAMPTPKQARAAFGLTGYNETGIREGRVGMWNGTLPGSAAEIQSEEWEFSWGVAPLPKNQQSATFAFVEGLVINKQAESPDACWLWIDFLTRQAPPIGMPVRQSIIDSKEFEESVGGEVAVVARASIEHALFFSPSGFDIYGSFQLFDEAINKVSAEMATVQEALDAAQAASQYK